MAWNVLRHTSLGTVWYVKKRSKQVSHFAPSSFSHLALQLPDPPILQSLSADIQAPVYSLIHYTSLSDQCRHRPADSLSPYPAQLASHEHCERSTTMPLLSIGLSAVITYSASRHAFCPKSFFTPALRPLPVCFSPSAPFCNTFSRSPTPSPPSFSPSHTLTHTHTHSRTLHTSCPAPVPWV